MTLQRYISVGVATCLLVLCLEHVWAAQDDDGVVALQHRVVMDPKGKFILSWTPREVDILVELQVTTQGYVGVGFSPNGGMKGADIIMGWVDDNDQPQILDMHGVGNRAPVVDESQDVELVNGWRNDSHTTLRFRRPWDTCDQQEDYLLSSDTVRVIYAYGGAEAPDASLGRFTYHGRERGVRSVQLQEKIPINIEFGDDVRHWDILSPNVSIPEKLKTVYWCKVHKLPELEGKHHFIGYDPVITTGNEALVHHMVLYECLLPESDLHYAQWAQHGGNQCYSPTMPLSWYSCQSPIVAWAIGGKGGRLPEHVGLPLGEEHNGATYFMLEVHYDNPANLKGIVDESGIRIYFTQKTRKFDAGIIKYGIEVRPSHVIAPVTEAWTNVGHCDATCTRTAYPPEGVQLIGGFLHGHLLASQLKLQLIRDGKELEPILEDKSYDFNFQQERILKVERTLLPGDHVIFACTYNSSTLVRPTFGGLGTTDEMCLAYILYYPRSSLLSCRSYVTTEALMNSIGIQDLYPVDQNSLKLRNKLKNQVKANENVVPGENSIPLHMYAKFNAFKIKEPFALQNMTLLQLLRERSLWRNKQVVRNLRHVMDKGSYVPVCVVKNNGETKTLKLPTTPYPEFEPYRPPERQCNMKKDGGNK